MTLEISEFKGLEQAKHATVHQYRGGAVALGKSLGVHKSTLSNKVNVNMPNHKLSLNESIRIQQVTKHYAILHETARLLDHVCLPIQDVDLQDISDLDLVDSWSKWHAQIGVTVQTMRDSLEDKIITDDEVRAIERDMHREIACGMALVERFKVMSQRPRK